MSACRYRTIFLSDAHLGIRESNAEFLLDFLKQHDADRYFLVGDIFDGWALRRSWYWPESHNDIIQMLLEKAKNAAMTYIPGNHDEAARRFPGLRLGDITIRKQAMHTTADGRRFLVLHGDEFDGVICGHIHHPEMRTIDGVQYVNTGDWVESCTALVEHHDGTLEILRWIPSLPDADTSLMREPLFAGDGQMGDGQATASEPVLSAS